MDLRRRNNVVVTGRDGGPMVVLAHGFGCDQNLWRRVVPDLAEKFTVLTFDHVGVGRSDLTAWSAERYASLDGYAQDVREICRGLGPGPSPCNIDDPDAGYRGGFSAPEATVATIAEFTAA